jgi:peptidoglycan/xylan/chitin deacetylase (PgdA/CDA1 family)
MLAVAIGWLAGGTLAAWGPAVLGAAIAAIVANHVLLTAAGLCPRCSLLGRNITRIPGQAGQPAVVAITIDDGPDPEVTPAVLDLLRDHGAQASFFLVAQRAERHPALVARIVAEGHSVENHTQAHSHGFSFSGPARLSGEIARAQASLARLAGEPPRFFRAPAGLRNPLLAPVLCRLGLPLTSWTRRGFDTVTADPDRVLRRLAGEQGRLLAPGDILLLHDGNAARDRDGAPVILSVLPRLLAACRERGLRPVGLREAFRDAPDPCR